MTTPAVLTAPRAGPPRQRHDAEILCRLGTAKGQLAGITSMYEDDRCCIDILDQPAAARAAIDAAGLVLPQDHINACVRDAIDSGEQRRQGCRARPGRPTLPAQPER